MQLQDTGRDHAVTYKRQVYTDLPGGGQSQSETTIGTYTGPVEDRTASWKRTPEGARISLALLHIIHDMTELRQGDVATLTHLGVEHTLEVALVERFRFTQQIELVERIGV